MPNAYIPNLLLSLLLYHYILLNVTGINQVVVANPWLFRGVLTKVMLKGVTTAAVTRTTTAVTVSRTGAKVRFQTSCSLTCSLNTNHPNTHFFNLFSPLK
jgi:hypothetical protein